MKKFLAIMVAVCLMCTLTVSAFASESSQLVRTFDSKTGSHQYQYDDEELERLNHLLKVVDVTTGDFSRADFLRFTSPDLYDLQQNKEQLENIIWQPDFTASETSVLSPRYNPHSYDSTLQRYGASIKGYTWVDGGEEAEIWIDLFIMEQGTLDVVGYTEATGYDTDFLDASCIIDPPDGTYFTHSELSWTPLMAQHRYVTANSEEIYYDNPYF